MNRVLRQLLNGSGQERGEYLHLAEVIHIEPLEVELQTFFVTKKGSVLCAKGGIAREENLEIEADFVEGLAPIVEEALCHPEQSPDAHIHAHLFAHLAGKRVTGDLPHFNPAARYRPEVLALQAVEEHPVAVNDQPCCPQIEDVAVALQSN